ncbi:MAG: type II toxin-antitoxin system RelE/ParE family toxin [Chitinophagaceae bacterium]
MLNDSAYFIIISRHTQEEILNSWEWYEEQRKGLGDLFIENIMNRIQDIQDHPELYIIRYKGYREAMVNHFPFLIIFKINKREKIVRVLSVFHISRSPKKKH